MSATCLVADSGPLIGKLGLLVRANEEDFVAALCPLIELLRSTDYFLSDDLVAQALSSRNE